MIFGNYQLYWKFSARMPDGRHVVSYVMQVIHQEDAGLRTRDYVFTGFGVSFAEATIVALTDATKWFEANKQFIDASSNY